MIDKPLSEPHKPRVSAMQALIRLTAVVPLTAGLIALGMFIGVTNFLFVGFVFVLYWAGIKATAPAEFVPSLVGALGGLGLAYLIHALPAALGASGAALAAICVLISVYLLFRRQAAVMINDAFMLVLTICTCTAFKHSSDYAVAAVSIIIAALYSGGLFLVGRTILSRKSKATISRASAG